MQPLDLFEKWAPRLEASARRFLSEGEYQEYQRLPEPERSRQLRALLEKPIAQFTPLNEVFFRARWAEAVCAVHPTSDLTLLEVASGDADMIPQMMAHTCPGSRYITANMNKQLTERLLRKTKHLPIQMQVIEEDAAAIARYLGPHSVDLVAFQHAVNDVIQAILCDREGLDTIDTDWMETLPAMIKIMQREVSENTLDQHAKGPFLALLENLCMVLKPDGLFLMNHYMFQLDLDWGYPPDLFENIIPLTREWVKDLPGCREVRLEGFDPQWWLFLQKVS